MDADNVNILVKSYNNIVTKTKQTYGSGISQVEYIAMIGVYILYIYIYTCICVCIYIYDTGL